MAAKTRLMVLMVDGGWAFVTPMPANRWGRALAIFRVPKKSYDWKACQGFGKTDVAASRKVRAWLREIGAQEVTDG